VTKVATAQSLSLVVNTLRHELDQIESAFASSISSNTVDQYKISYAPAEVGCLVSLWDAWNRFVRSLLLLSSAGTVEGLSGTIHNPSIARSEIGAITHITSHRRGTNISVTRGEIAWYKVAAIGDLVSLLGLSNQMEIVSAVTSSNVRLGVSTIPNPLEEIRLCRNFVAHKCDVTLNDIVQYAPPALSDLRNYLRSKRHGVELFSDWKEGCLAIAEAAAQ